MKAEGALVDSIGSTGQGSERLRRDASWAEAPLPSSQGTFRRLKPFLGEAHRRLDNAFAEGNRVLLEGTQGTGLSIYHGFYPHVTSRDTTVSGCLAEAGIAPSRVESHQSSFVAPYPIRVQNPKGGTSGPMSRELSLLEIARRSGIPIKDLRKTERTSTTNRKRRIGEFDWELLRKSASLNGPTDIALTFSCRLSRRKEPRCQTLRSTHQDPTIRFLQAVEQVAGSPVSLISTRFHARSIIDRRLW